MNQANKILVYLILISGFLFTSCREEIINPDNIAGNINEPVKTQSPTSYSFIVNAEDISTDVIDVTTFYALRSSCYINIIDYSAGNVEIIIAGNNYEIIYRQIFASDISAIPGVFEGSSPQYVQFKFYNFTGKLRFELNKL